MKKKGKNRQFSPFSVWEKHMSGSAHYEGLRWEKEIGFSFQVFGNKWTRDKIPHVSTTYKRRGWKGFILCQKSEQPRSSYLSWPGRAINQVAWLGWGGIDLISFHSPPFPSSEHANNRDNKAVFFARCLYAGKCLGRLYFFFNRARPPSNLKPTQWIPRCLKKYLLWSPFF